jgi:two-component system response regulator
MLIEDNPDHALLIQTALEACPYVGQITLIEDGERAVHHIQAVTQEDDPALPALVILDLKLPKVDGLDVLRTLRAAPVWRTVPVVVLSTSTRPSEIAACFAHGANDYVTKVATPTELMTQVGDVATTWLTGTPLPES